MGTGGSDTEFAVIRGRAGDAGVCERRISHPSAGGVFLLVPEAVVCEPLVVGGILRGADRGDGVRALSFCQTGVRPGTFGGTGAAVGARGVWHAKPGVSRGGAGGVAGELLETGNGYGPAALPGIGVWSAGSHGVLPAASNRHIADPSQPRLLSHFRFALRLHGVHPGHADLP